MTTNTDDVEEFYSYARQTWDLWAFRCGWNKRIERADAIQSAAAHCWRVAPSYNPEMGASRRTYFLLCARRHLTNMVLSSKSRRRAKRTVSMDAHPIQKEGREPAPFAAMEQAEDLLAMHRALFALGERDEATQWVVLERMKGRTLQQIGDELGVTRERVRQREFDGVEAIAAMMRARA